MGSTTCPKLARLVPCIVLATLFSPVALGQQQVETYDSPGGDTFTVPDDVFQITVDVWGAGGRGGSVTSGNRGAGGGGGGAFAGATLQVTPGQVLNLFVGAGSNSANPGGDSWFVNDSTVLAKGGGSVGNNSEFGAVGGSGLDSLGDVTHPGGNGANGGTGQNADAGGGGSSAGSSAPGNSATGSAGAAAPADGGDGGDGSTVTVGDGEAGEQPGGGGGGARGKGNNSGTGGNGAHGRIVVTYTPQPPQLTLEYRMEQDQWTGASDEVLDTSGFGRHGTSAGDADTSATDPAIPGNPGTCRYGELDGNDDYLIDSDAGSYLDGLGAITVMAWVYNTDSLSGNDRGIFYTADPVGGRDNFLGMRYDSGGFFGGGSNVIKASVSTDECNVNDECHQVETVSNLMVQNQWQHVAMTWQSGQNIRVYVNGSEAGISAVVGAGIGGVIDNVDRLEIGFGAKSERWQGRIDEFRIFDGALSEADIQAQMNAAFPCELGYDHIRLTHPATALTCSPADISVQACADADCTALHGDPAQVDFTSPPATWIPDPVTFTGSTNVSLQYTTPGFVALDAVAVDPSAANPTRCFSGGVETNCEMEFLESGFIIAVADHISDSVVSGTIAAVRADPANPEQCVPGFDNETKDVGFWSDYVNPASGTLSPSVDGTVIASGSPGTAIAIAFDGNGEGSFELQYPDVGDLSLNARHEGSGDEAGLIMIGEDRFIARPARFTLDIPANPAASDHTGPVFTTAGSEFEVTVAARNASDAITPNFGNETPAEDVDLDLALIEPSGGAAPALAGSFSAFGSDCDGNPASPGTACGAFSWPEVGVISLDPRLASGAYLGTIDVVGTAVDRVGRFIPEHFDLGSSNIVNRAGVAGCISPFTYIGERFDAEFTLHARSAVGTTTTNYEGLFAFLDGDDLNLSATPAPDANAAGITWLMGVGDASAQLALPRSSPEGPYPSYEVTTAPVDSDGVALSGNDVIGSTELRYGRAVIDNAIGSELGPLVLPWRTEYWDGATWLVNADDACTALDLAADAELTSSGGDTGDGTATVSVGAGSTSIDASESELTLNAGIGSLYFTAPGSPGWVDAMLGLDTNWPFLHDDLDDDGNYNDDPHARASFGLFEGNDQRIYIREIQPQ